MPLKSAFEDVVTAPHDGGKVCAMQVWRTELDIQYQLEYAGDVAFQLESSRSQWKNLFLKTRVYGSQELPRLTSALHMYIWDAEAQRLSWLQASLYHKNKGLLIKQIETRKQASSLLMVLYRDRETQDSKAISSEGVLLQ